MKVYVAEQEYPDGDSIIIGVFASLDVAQKGVAYFIKQSQHEDVELNWYLEKEGWWHAVWSGTSYEYDINESDVIYNPTQFHLV